MKNISTLVILKTQFSNLLEGAKPASLTYEATYTGNDTEYVQDYENELMDEVVTQCDFWECVSKYKESFSVQVKVLGDPEGKEQLAERLRLLIENDLVIRVGRKPEESFWDDMSEEDKEKARRICPHLYTNKRRA